MKYIISLVLLFLFSFGASAQGKFYGGNGSGYTCAMLLSIPLPVELISFSGHSREYGNCLEWTTAAEINNSGFAVESSIDGLNFKMIGFIPSAGTSTQTQYYYFTDLRPNQGVSYYRLKQIDYDSGFEYSKIIAVRQEGKDKMSLYPNPSNGVFTIIGLNDFEDAQFTVMNSVGQTISLTVQKNGQLDLSAYPSGVYYLRLTSTGNVTKLFKE